MNRGGRDDPRPELPRGARRPRSVSVSTPLTLTLGAGILPQVADEPALTPLSDESLMNAYVAGDARAFEQLFERYAGTVLGLGRRHLGSDDAARELVQQTFLRLHGARRDFRKGERLHPWLMTIVMNLVRDQWRSRKRKPVSSLQYEPADERPSNEAEHERLDRARRAKLLHDALGSLPQGQREVVELHWLQERPFAEVAAIVGSTEGAVRVRAHRAYAKLKELLGAELEREA